MTTIDPYSPTQVVRRGGHFGRRKAEHVVVLVLDPEEAENVADAIGWSDGAYKALYEAAAEARTQDGIPT